MQHPPWPQKFKPLTLLFAIAIAVAAVLTTAICLRRLVYGDVEFALGFGGAAYALAMAAVLTTNDSGVRYTTLSPKITLHNHPEHGAGVEIPSRRWVSRVLIGLMLGVSMYSATAALAYSAGHGDKFLPFGRDTRGGAIFLVSSTVVLVAVALLMATSGLDTTVRVYRDGVERLTHRRILLVTTRAQVFLHWNDIMDVAVGDLGVRLGSAKYPVIDLHTATALSDEQRLPHHDTDRKATIMAHALVAEPNTLFALLNGLWSGSTDRDRIASPDALELLRPPPLRERLRAARMQEVQ